MSQTEQKQDQKGLDSLRQNSRESSSQYSTSNNESKEQNTIHDTSTDLSRYKVKRYHLSTVTNSGKTIPAGTIPILTFRSELYKFSIDFCQSDIQFNVYNDNVTLDSIKIRTIDTAFSNLRIQIEIEKANGRDPQPIIMKYATQITVDTPDDAKDTLTIHSPMLVDVPLSKEMAYLERKLTYRGILADIETKEKIIDLLSKNQVIEVAFYSKDYYGELHSKTVEFLCLAFKDIYDEYLLQALKAPSYKKKFALKHQVHSNKIPQFANITIPPERQDTTKYWKGFTVDQLSDPLHLRNTSNKRPARKKISRTDPPYKKSDVSVQGERPLANIMKTLRNNKVSVTYAFNRRRKVKPNLKGKVVFKWSIDHNGDVLSCMVLNSTLNDPYFEQEITRKIRAWNFGYIPNKGDITTITYPFTFGS